MSNEPIAEIIDLGTQYGVLFKSPMPGRPNTEHSTYPMLITISPELYKFMLACVKLGVKYGIMSNRTVELDGEIMNVSGTNETRFYIHTSNLTGVRTV